MALYLFCPKCEKPIDSSGINVKTDLAKCENCGTLSTASALIMADSIDAVMKPPSGSSIEMINRLDGSLRLLIPKKGWTTAMIFQSIYTVFFLFMGIYVTQPLLIVPHYVMTFILLFPTLLYWFMALSMLNSLLNSIFETQQITITKTQLIVQKNQILQTKKLEFDLSDIHDVKSVHIRGGRFSALMNIRFMWRIQFSFGAGIVLPGILIGSKTHYFAEECSDAEQDWLIKIIRYRIF
jgi:hypothetical protein